MFGKLYNKIYYPFFLLAVSLIIIIDALAAFVTVDTLRDTYTVMGEKKITQIMNSFKLYVNSAETSTYNLSHDEVIADELYEPAGQSLMQKLEDTCNYSLKINAVTAYSRSGAVYTSATVAQVPSLETLRLDGGIAAFLDGDEESYISLRTRYMAGIYNNTLYDERMGIITCCRKVYKEGQLAGWIFTDILPANLYSYVFGEGLFEDAVAFLVTGDGYFSYNNNAAHEELLNGEKSGNYFLYRKQSDDGRYSLAVYDSKTEYYGKIAMIFAILTVASALLVIAVHFGARATARSVTVRLDRFLNRMNAQELP